MKTCYKCKIKQDISKFCKNKSNSDGLSTYCKICIKVINKKRREEIKNNTITEVKLPKTIAEKKKESKRKHYLKNKDKIAIKAREYREKNKDKTHERRKKYKQKNKKELSEKAAIYRQKNKEKIKEQSKLYIQKNKEKLKEYQIKYNKENSQLIKNRRNNRRKNDPAFKLGENISHNIRSALRGRKKTERWEKLVGYTVKDLKKHLESKFTKGMSWANHSFYGWHIDHIIPQYYFKWDTCDHPAFKACWALSNLQPLWATKEIAMSYGEGPDYIGNIDKGNRVELSDEVKDFLKSINN